MNEPAHKRKAETNIDERDQKKLRLEPAYLTEQTEQAEQKNRDKKYQELLACDFFFEASGKIREDNQELPPLKNIEMDHYYSTVPGEVAIATSGVYTCFAIAATATDTSNQPFLALAHVTSLIEGHVKEVLEAITTDLIKKDCSRELIKFYIVGGIDAETTDMQNEFIDLSEEFNIVGALFNPIDIYSNETETDFSDSIEDSINIVLTRNKLYYGNNLIFTENTEQNNGGISLEKIL